MIESTELAAAEQHAWTATEDLRHVMCETCGKKLVRTPEDATLGHRQGCAYASLLRKLRVLATR